MDSNLVILLPRLRQTCGEIERYSAVLGEYGDTPALRKRLSELEAAARDGVRDIERAILDSNRAVVQGGNQRAQREMQKVEDQFVVDKKNAQAVLDRAAARRKAAGSKPRSEGGAPGGSGVGVGGAGSGAIVIEMKNLTAVDAQIAEVRDALRSLFSPAPGDFPCFRPRPAIFAPALSGGDPRPRLQLTSVAPSPASTAGNPKRRARHRAGRRGDQQGHEAVEHRDWRAGGGRGRGGGERRDRARQHGKGRRRLGCGASVPAGIPLQVRAPHHVRPPLCGRDAPAALSVSHLLTYNLR